MNSASSTQAADFVNSVLGLHPRVAVFDCDGTLWSDDAGEGFFSWELEQNLLSDDIVRWARARNAAYREGRVPEHVICGEMVTMHCGLTDIEVQRLANRYFDEYFLQRIFPELRELIDRLQESGCPVWAVSSTNEWVIRAAMRHFTIPEERVIAAAGRVVNGVVTDSLVRVPTGEGKPKAIQELIGRVPDAAFGNSIWDAAMLGIVRYPFVINPTPELEKVAQQRRWPVYWPERAS